ncbi:Na/Pi symporter [Cerasicoccus maritimus]|uniref:Na/Pi symporter n=1 Tax=Cerasicoccus maritimus TaxID=490089 RepID=UPI0028529A70|nr:Na/Pi symporter [Cerasicoccus maritimus]
MQIDNILGGTLAGLGFYFLGVGGIRSSLQQIPGIKFREQIGRATAHPIRAAFTGFTLGTITQTSIGVAVILAGLISRGLTTVRQALPLIAWSNLGLVTLVFINYLEVHVLAMFLVGIGGICINFKLGGRFKGLFPPLYSLGLILVGLWLLKTSLTELAHHPQFDDFIQAFPAMNLIAFLFAVLLRIPVQSTSAVAVIGIIMHKAGIFTEDQALLTFYGTAIGTAGAAYFLTAHFRGEMRQVTLFEAAINGIAGLILLALFYGERLTGAHLFHSYLEMLPGGAELHLALAFLFQQVLVVIVAYVFFKPILFYINKSAPRTVAEDLSATQFIHDQAVFDVETGLQLARQEIRGLVNRMPQYLACVRTEGKVGPTRSINVWHDSSLAIIEELESFLGAIASRRVKSTESSLELLDVQRSLDHLIAVEESMTRFVQSHIELRKIPALHELSDTLAEALDAVIVTMLETAPTDPDDLQLIARITAAPGARAETLRQKYLHNQDSLSHDERALAIRTITRHERIAWSINQWANSLLADLEHQATNNEHHDRRNSEIRVAEDAGGQQVLQ